MKRYQKIDLFRLLCAALVVLIHTVEVRNGHPYAYMLVTCFAGQAVPFFFIVSGFFLAKKLDTAPDPFGVLRKQVTHNLLLYAAWMVVELPGMIVTYTTRYPDASIVYYATLLIRRVLLAGQGVYWFILILAEALLISGLLLIRRKEKPLYILAAVGMLLRVVYKTDLSFWGLGYLNKLFYIVFSWDNNVVMSGLPFVTIGIFFARNEKRLKISQGILTAGYGILGMVSVILFFLAYRLRPDLIYLIIPGDLQAIVLFLIALQPTGRSYSERLCGNCRDLSTCLYYLHTIFIYNVANHTIGLHAPVLQRYAIAFLPPVLIWLIVQKLNWKPAKWMLSMR